MNAKEYHQQFVQLVTGIPAITDSEIQFREIDENECYLKAVLRFASGHSLHLAEYIVIEGESVRRDKYRYQLLDAQHQHISRWDNAPHHHEVETFP